MRIGRALHWCLCMFHLNELPLRQLFVFMDGKTTGPQTFNGFIGKSLSNCETLPIVNFEVINASPLCNFSDQQYFLDIIYAVTTGEIKDGLEKRSPGNLVQSRWLTLANRVLRLYIAMEGPSFNLRLLTEFIIRSYSVVWFSIKPVSYTHLTLPTIYSV